MKNTLIITAFAALAAAQSISDLPACSLSCLTTAIPQLGCGLTDLKCSCQKAGELTPILTPCVQKSCSEVDQKKTLEVLAAICAANGAAISTPPASSVVAPEETATPEPLPSPSSVETQPSASKESSVAESPSGYPASSHLSSDVPNLPSPSSYSNLVPLPSIVGTDTVIVSRPSPQPSSVPGVLPPYPTGSPVSLPSPLPTGSGVSTPSVSSTMPEFTGAAEARNVPVVAAGLLGLAAFVL
ncbi:hypothetical protein G6514_008952 [Epicoccum nigrum]|nr:hypothetical protein G6514_008952 [Epicoccum nigrum]